MINKMILACCALLMLVTTTACAPPLLIAGAAAGVAGASVISDKRTAGVVFEDKRIEIRAVETINDDGEISDATHVSVTSYNQVVLLTGQAASEEDRQRIIDHVSAIEGVRGIHDHIEISDPTGLRQRSRDTLTTARIKSELVGNQGLASAQIKVVTENDIVYLMGLVTRAQAEKIVPVVQQVEGIRGVVLVFEYVG